MSWSKFLTSSPPIKKPTDISQLKSSMKKKSLRLDESTSNCFLKCDTEQQERRVNFKDDQYSCLSDVPSRPKTLKNKSNYTLKESTLYEINQTLKQIKSLTLENNANMKRFINIIEEKQKEKERSSERYHKSKSKDIRSTIKKSKSKKVIENKVNSRFKEFQKIKKQMEVCMRRISTTARLKK